MRSPGGGIRGFELVALVAAALVFLSLVAGARKVRIPPDGRDYLEFAEAIQTGELFARQPSVDVPKALAIRTPGYPVLLAVAEAIRGERAAAVWWAHVCVGLATLLYVPLALRRLCPLLASTMALLWVQWAFRGFLRAPLAEWTCLNALLVLFAGSALYWERPRTMRLVWLGLLCSFLVLTRPALIAVSALPLALALLQKGQPRLRSLANAYAPFVLVVLWMGFNLFRLGSFSLTPFTGMNLVGVASLIGHAEPLAGDDPELAKFVHAFNEGKRPRPPGFLDVRGLDSEQLAVAYNYNVHQVAERIASQQRWDRVTYDAMLVTYGLRVIREQPGRYLQWVVAGLGELESLLPFVLPAVVLPVFWLRRGRNVGLSLATLSVVVLHVAHVAVCAAVEVVLLRYRALTELPVLFASLVMVSTWARPYVRREWSARGGGRVAGGSNVNSAAPPSAPPTPQSVCWSPNGSS